VSESATQQSPGSAGSKATPPTTLPPLGFVGWLRWAWRQLTSMRTALVLLFLLALAAIPGSVLPQRNQSPIRVNDYITTHHSLGPIFNKLGLFDVYASAWFGAIYFLLLVSVAGCIVPRIRHHARALQAQPPAAPRNLERLPAYTTFTTTAAPEDVVVAGTSYLKSKRWRVRKSDAPSDGWPTTSLGSEKGYMRETGNLIFHTALLFLVLGVALGSLWGFRGQVIVKTGDGFSNTLSQYDEFRAGRLFSTTKLPPFSFVLDKFDVTFEQTGTQAGAPRQFTAHVTLYRTPGAKPEHKVIEVNHPLNVDGVNVFLTGHGYAPHITVRSKDGTVLYTGSTAFLPQDRNFTSTGVVKLPDVTPQLGLQGIFLPTSTIDPVRGPISTFPAPNDPGLFLSAWEGDLGLDKGVPQSVYRLDTTHLTKQGIRALRPGQTWTLPDGRTVKFDGVSRFASFQIAREPGSLITLVAAIFGIIGLLYGLFVPRRRLWVRAQTQPDGLTLVSVAGLSRSETPGLAEEVESVATELASRVLVTSSVPQVEEGSQ
jgi:cytochrome c biogenesis protein